MSNFRCSLRGAAVSGVFLSILSLGAQLSCAASTGESRSNADKTSSSSGSVSVYDGRFVKVHWDISQWKPAPSLSKAEAQLFNKELIPQAKKHWTDKEASDTKALAVLSGAFTKKGAKQKLVYYQYVGSYPGGTFGIAVIQDGKIVVHYTFEGAMAGDLKVLPDLNNDGRNEIAFESWSMHQGYRHGGVFVCEVGAETVKPFGYLEIADDDNNSGKYYKFELTAKTGASPKFQSTKYQKIRSKWTKLGKTTAVTPRESEFPEYIKL